MIGLLQSGTGSGSGMLAPIAASGLRCPWPADFGRADPGRAADEAGVVAELAPALPKAARAPAGAVPRAPAGRPFGPSVERRTIPAPVRVAAVRPVAAVAAAVAAALPAAPEACAAGVAARVSGDVGRPPVAGGTVGTPVGVGTGVGTGGAGTAPVGGGDTVTGGVATVTDGAETEPTVVVGAVTVTDGTSRADASVRPAAARPAVSTAAPSQIRARRRVLTLATPFLSRACAHLTTSSNASSERLRGSSMIIHRSAHDEGYFAHTVVRTMRTKR